MPAATATQNAPPRASAGRTIYSGDPGTIWVNTTEKIQYQFVASLRNTCGVCLQYHLKIGAFWPIPLHWGCRCQQRAIKPGAHAPEAFCDYRQILDDMPADQQVKVIGSSNLKLLNAGVIGWDAVVTPSRIRDLHEVVHRLGLKVEQMTAVGIKPSIAIEAHATVNTAAHQLAEQQRRKLIDQLRGAGVSQADLISRLSTGLAERVSVAEGAGSILKSGEQLGPAWAGGRLRVGPNHGDELATLMGSWRPSKKASTPPKPEAPQTPTPRASEPEVEVSPAVPGSGPGEAIPRPEKPAAKGRSESPFTEHRFGESGAEVEYHDSAAEAAARKLLGPKITKARIASLAGAPDDARVKVEAHPTNGSIEITVEHPAFERMMRTIRKEGRSLIIHNDVFKVRPEFQGTASGNLALKAFARQVENAHALGVSRIETLAYRSRNAGLDPTTGKEKWAGYYVWPRYGYNGPLPDHVKTALAYSGLPRKLAEAQEVKDLMADRQGREWWRQNGVPIDVVFDLKKKSYSLRTLDAYLKEVLEVK